MGIIKHFKDLNNDNYITNNCISVLAKIDDDIGQSHLDSYIAHKCILINNENKLNFKWFLIILIPIFVISCKSRQINSTEFEKNKLERNRYYDSIFNKSYNDYPPIRDSVIFKRTH